jgi:Zn-dependent protease
MKGSLFIGKFAGIRVFIHWTFTILLLWIAISGMSRGQNVSEIGWTFLFIFAVFACVTLHEFGHALAAKRYNFKTKHITLLPIGGLAQMEKLPDNPKQELVVAIAGPMVNVVIALLLFPLVYTQEFTQESLSSINPGNFLIYLFIVNIILAVFNMLPAFPMDGGRVLRALLSFKLPREKATQVAASLGQFMAMVFVLLGLFYNPFLVLIGIFIFLGAQAENSMVQSQSFLKGYFVRDVLMRDFASLQMNDRLSTATSILLNSQSTDFVVFDKDEFIGILSRNELLKGLSELGADAEISKVVNRDMRILKLDQALEEIYPEMKVKGQNLLPVMESDKLIGVLDSENLMEFILVKEAMRAARSEN